MIVFKSTESIQKNPKRNKTNLLYVLISSKIDPKRSKGEARTPKFAQKRPEIESKLTHPKKTGTKTDLYNMGDIRNDHK